MKEGVTTLPGSLGVNPPQWTTAHKDVPPEWLSQEGHPCMIGGKAGVMQLVNDRLVCVVSPRLEAGKAPTDDEVDELARKWKAADFNYAKNPTHIYRQRLAMHAKNLAAAREKQKRFSKPSPPKESTEMDTTVITEGTNLHFASASRTQIAKPHVYFDVRRRQVGLDNVRVSKIQGVQGNWFFDVSSHENNQFLDPTRLHNILPADVTVTASAPPTPQTASQDEVRNAIREMVEQRFNELIAEKS